jgi:hypothetical protein
VGVAGETATHKTSITPRGLRPKPLAIGTRSNLLEDQAGTGAAVLFTFPEDARWSSDRQEVEFGVEIGEYHGVVRVPRRVFQRF